MTQRLKNLRPPPPPRNTLRGSGPASASYPWRMVEPYRIIRRLKPGSSVFEGYDANTTRQVTIQLIRTDDEAWLAETLGERGRLNHPRTARLLDAGVIAEPKRAVYLVREFVAGTSLAQMTIQRNALTTVHALRVMLQVLDSLEEAHDKGLAHGRLCPQHVMVRRGDSLIAHHVKLIGYWGAASSPTPARYVPSNCTSARDADLFAVARMLLDCVAGPASTVHGLRSAPNLSVQPLTSVLEQALHVDPQRRFGDVGALREALVQCLRAETPSGGMDALVVSGDPLRANVMVPAKSTLASTRPSAIWVLGGDPATTSPIVHEAVASLAAQHEVRTLDAQAREAVRADLLLGRVPLPWVVVYGGLHVLTDDRLLSLLASSAELSRVLITSHQNLELLQTAIGQGGLDRHISLPCDAAQIVEAVHGAVSDTRRLSNYYDSIRLALRKVRDEVGQLSRTLAARDTDLAPNGFARSSLVSAGGSHG